MTLKVSYEGFDQDGGGHALILMRPLTMLQVVQADTMRPIIGAVGGECPESGDYGDSIRINFPSRNVLERIKADCQRLGLDVEEVH